MAKTELIHPLDVLLASPLEEGDLLLGVSSGGIAAEDFHYDPSELALDSALLDTRLPELGCTVSEELRKPTRSYEGLLEKLARRDLCPKRAALVDGSLSRRILGIMPEGLSARIVISSFPVPATFELIASQFRLSAHDMFDHFNMGIGMVLVIPRQDVGDVKNALCCYGERAYIKIGRAHV